MNLTSLLDIAIKAAERASVEILDVYNSDDFEAELKGDNSPLTLADKKAHQVITSILESTNLPNLSEEGKSISYSTRKQWDLFWMVDPLDGTKEFIKRNGEFTVNIALIHHGKPILGVVAVPVTNEIFYGAKELGAAVIKNRIETKLETRKPINLKQPGLRVVASRSHLNQETEDFINSLVDPVTVSKGSSLKFMLLAEGLADIYPRFAPTMEWDTAAAHAVVSQLGFKVLQQGTEFELQYNKENLLNPGFVVR